MKIIIEFEDLEDALLHLHARDLYISLLNIKQTMRNYRKHGDLTEEQYAFFEKLDDEIASDMKIFYKLEN